MNFVDGLLHQPQVLGLGTAFQSQHGGPHLGEGGGQHRHILEGGGEDFLLGHVQHGPCLYHQHVGVLLHQNVVAGPHFRLGIHAMATEQGDVLFLQIQGHGIGGGF